jgi:hypothetical protein
MLHEQLNTFRNRPKVRIALLAYKEIYRNWLLSGDATGYKAGQTPLHLAEAALNAAVENELMPEPHSMRTSKRVSIAERLIVQGR